VGLHAARRSNPQRCSRRPWRRPGELPAGARVAAHGWVPPPRQRSLHLPLLRPAGRRAMASRSGVEAQCPLVCSRPAAAPTRACRRPAAAPSPAHHRPAVAPSRGWIDSWRRSSVPHEIDLRHGRAYNGAGAGGKGMGARALVVVSRDDGTLVAWPTGGYFYKVGQRIIG
jgi:hypothetical protein